MFLTFGEIMMRIVPEGFLRLRQAIPGRVDVTFGGGEANVAVSLAMLGREVRYLTALPRNPMADAAVDTLRGLGVETGDILRRDEGRLGIYFLETGANQRSSCVVYDRAHSAVSLAVAAEYDMDAALRDVTWLHITGITPAISENAFEATLHLARAAKERRAVVSCDLNYRKKLWRWRPGAEQRELAEECMSRILPCVDLAIGNEEDAEKVLGITAKGTAVEKGEINAGAYEDVARQVVARFPNISRVAITLRGSVSASHNEWGAVLFDGADDKVFFGPTDEQGRYSPYQVTDIVDRVGGGDSFVAGLIHALNHESLGDPATAVRFAAAASCLKHSVKGDFNLVTEAEVVSLMQGDASGRVKR